MTIFTIFDHFGTISFSYSEFFGRFDTSGSMIPRLVPEISPCDAFYDEQEEQEQQELGILGSRYHQISSNIINYHQI